MKKMKTISLLFLATSLLTFSACKKDKYQPIGDYGNANIESSTVTITNWTYSAPSYYGTITYGAITQDVLDNGAVLVYLSSGSGSWTQIPITVYTSASYSSTIEAQISLGTVRIFWTDSDLTQPGTPPNLTFKIVAMGPDRLAEFPNLDYSNYEEVKNSLNLKD